jgi:predicted transcriptional regulator
MVAFILTYVTELKNHVTEINVTRKVDKTAAEAMPSDRSTVSG